MLPIHRGLIEHDITGMVRMACSDNFCRQYAAEGECGLCFVVIMQEVGNVALRAFNRMAFVTKQSLLRRNRIVSDNLGMHVAIIPRRPIPTPDESIPRFQRSYRSVRARNFSQTPFVRIFAL